MSAAIGPRRQRAQRGHLEPRGPTWFLRIREEVVDRETGELRRQQRRVEIGPRSELRSEAAARAAADAWLARLSPETLEPGPRIAALAYFEHYLATHVPLMRRTSQRKYRSVIRFHFRHAFEGERLDEIDTARIQKLIALLAPRRARGTVRSIRAILLQVLRQARADGYGAHKIDPATVRLPKATTAERERRHIDGRELDMILRASEWPWRALWAALGLAALRIGEGLGLTWSHVDFERRIVRVRQACVLGQLQPVKTATSRADVPMLPELERILLEYRNVWRPNDAGLLFATRDGTPLHSDDVRRRELRFLLRGLGLAPAGTHAFRHGVPARLNDAGCSPATIQQFMRHGSLEMTERYLHHHAEDVRAALDAAATRLTAARSESST